MGGALDGKVAAVTGADAPLVAALARVLASAGASIGLVGDAEGLSPLVTDLEACDTPAAAVGCAFETRDDVEAAFTAVVDGVGAPVDVVLHGAIDPIAYERCAFEDVDDARWDTVWEQTMRSTLFTFQAGHTQMQGRGGRIVLITPTVAMSGAEQLVPYTCAIEGQRLLAKSAARQWGSHGITVNCLAPAPEHVPIGVPSTAVSLAPPALGGPGDPEHDLGPALVFLTSDAGHFLTGITLCADGGVWMAP